MSSSKGVILQGRFREEPEVDHDELFVTQVEGVFVIGFLGATKRKVWGREVWTCAFRILEVVKTEKEYTKDEWEGRLVPRFLNVPTENRRRRSLTGWLAGDYRRLIERLPPKHLHKIKPSAIYADCQLKARLSMYTRDHQRMKVEPGARYTRVEQIMEIVQGCPPELRRVKERSR